MKKHFGLDDLPTDQYVCDHVDSEKCPIKLGRVKYCVHSEPHIRDSVCDMNNCNIGAEVIILGIKCIKTLKKES